MKCDYSIILHPTDPAVDTLDVIYIGGNAYPIGLPFGVTLIEINAVVNALNAIVAQALLDIPGSEISGSGYVKNGAEYTLSIFQSNVAGQGVDFTIDGNPDGSGISEGNCQKCDFSVQLDNSNNKVLDQLCWIAGGGENCQAALNIDLSDLAAIETLFNNSFGSTYDSIDVTLGLGFTEIIVHGSTTKFSKIVTKDNFQTVNSEFAETNCIDPVAPSVSCSSVENCQYQDMPITGWLGKVLAKNSNLPLIGIHITEESGAPVNLPCNNDLTAERIFKNALRGEVDDCMQLAVTIEDNPGTQPGNCDWAVSLDEIAKKVVRIDDNGCFSIAICQEGATAFRLCQMQGHSTLQLLKMALRVDDEGNWKLAAAILVFDNCEERCANAQVMHRIRDIFLTHGLNRWVIYTLK